MSDNPDTSTKELNDSEQILLDEIFKEYKLHHKTINGCFHDHVAFAHVKAAILQRYISKEEVERALPAKKGSEGYWPGKPPITDQEIGWNDATVAIRKNLGLDDKS